MFLVKQVLFVCILWHSCHILSLCNTLNMLFFRGMDINHSKYNLRHYGKQKILLLDTCLLYLYLTPEWAVQYLSTYHNNVTYISSVVSHGD